MNVNSFLLAHKPMEVEMELEDDGDDSLIGFSVSFTKQPRRRSVYFSVLGSKAGTDKMGSPLLSILLSQGLSSSVLGFWPFGASGKCQDSRTFELSPPPSSCAGSNECPSFECEIDFQDITSVIHNINCHGLHNDHDYKVASYNWDTNEIILSDITDPTHSPITFTTSTHPQNSQNIFPHPLNPRDSKTISIHAQINDSNISHAANGAKFEVVNNAKNANIAMGDHSNHTADFDSFGDKNMMNSTGSNTGGWNTKNRGSSISPGEDGQEKSGSEDDGEGEQDQEEEKKRKRETINLDIGANSKGSNVTRSGNENVIELYVPGDRDHVVNITIKMEGMESRVGESGNRNLVKIYIGDLKRGGLEGARTVEVPVS